MGIPCLWGPKHMLKRHMFDSFAILSGGILRNDVILQKCPGWCGQANLYMSPVWNYVIYWGMMTPWIDSLALRKKKLHIPQKTVSDHHCYFKIVIWGIFQLRANQFHVASVIPCPVRSQFYTIISPWHPHIIYIYVILSKSMYHYNLVGGFNPSEKY